MPPIPITPLIVEAMVEEACYAHRTWGRAKELSLLRIANWPKVLEVV
jgi:hypothetical protein